MITTVEYIAVLSCTLFAGAAIYISFVEHPARMSRDTKTAATVMQATLVILSFLTGVAA